MTQPTDRADRILDAAAELMVRLGYRKVTIDDIARRAGIGKGTVYLHWRTKEQLFEALIMRESIGVLNGLVEAFRADPAEVLPHRFFARSFLAAMRDPLMKALVTGDTAGSYDFNQTMKQRIWWVFAFVLGLAFLLLLLTFRSIVIPIKAIVLNLLSVGAAYGVLVWIFQYGHLQGLLNFQSNGGIVR